MECSTYEKAARHSCNYDRANVHTKKDDDIIAQNYGRGSLIGGLLVAVSFGSMLVHAAVM